MGSWVRTITSPFRKACTIFAPPQRDGKKPPHHQPSAAVVVQQEVERTSKLRGEVMACAYEDVQVMWSMLDKARIRRIDASS